MGQSNSPIVSVRDVRRAFTSTKKGEGFKGAINLLLKPEKVTTEALKGVSFDLEPGSFTGLIGANGAGKTTLLKILSGLLAPTSGEARVLGVDPFTRPLDFRRKISLVMGQKAQLWWDLPGIDAFDLLQAIYEIPKPVYKERVNTLAELLDVKKHLNTQIRRLSLGERMKMELIGAIVHWPSLIFLDEPTIGLDVVASAKLREFLKVHNEKEHATIILTSHNMDDIEKLCSRVLIMREGKMIYDGNPDGLTKKGECQLRVRLFQKPTSDEVASVAGIAAANVTIAKPEGAEDSEEEALDNHFLTIQYDQIAPVLQKLMGKYQIIEMGIQEQSLESVIQRLFA